MSNVNPEPSVATNAIGEVSDTATSETASDQNSWFSKFTSIFSMLSSLVAPFRSAASSLEKSASRIEAAMDSRNSEDRHVRTSYQNFEQFSAERKNGGFLGSSRPETEFKAHFLE